MHNSMSVSKKAADTGFVLVFVKEFSSTFFSRAFQAPLKSKINFEAFDGVLEVTRALRFVFPTYYLP